jgi:hypothetical protein
VDHSTVASSPGSRPTGPESGPTASDSRPASSDAWPGSPRPPRRVIGFPDVVNELAARTVAGVVAALAVTIVVTGWLWLLLLVAYGFWARVLTGPTLSPLARLAVHVVAPRLGPERPTPGPPKRFAQGIGAALSSAALVAWALGAPQVAVVLTAMIAVAATLESALGFCLGCKIFALAMRVGLIPQSVCEACNDLSRRPSAVGR